LKRWQILLTTLVYACCVLMGDVLHGLAHHLAEHHHVHTLKCLAAAVVDGAADEGVEEPAETSYTGKECDLKLALHAFMGRTYEKAPTFTFQPNRLSEPFVVFRDTGGVFLRAMRTPISARGPPLRA
jgi:hypothetical protein